MYLLSCPQTCEFQLWERKRLSHDDFIFQRSSSFFLNKDFQTESSAYLFLITYYLFFHICSLTVQIWSSEKKKTQLNNSPLKQDTDNVTFTKWQFSSEYSKAKTLSFYSKIWFRWNVFLEEINKYIFLYTYYPSSIRRQLCLMKCLLCQASPERNICNADHCHNSPSPYGLSNQSSLMSGSRP